MASSAGLHEPAESMTPQVIDRHRAIVSLQEELEAVDWYDQRVAATDDASLAAILAHNRDEEKEHAAMTLEWLRRHDSGAGPAPAHVPVHRGARSPRSRSRPSTARTPSPGPGPARPTARSASAA